MGNPKFYFFPEPDGSNKVTIDLGEGLAEFFFDFEVERNTGVAMDGAMYRATTTHRQIITIQRDRFTAGEDLAIKFAALQNHLDRGFSCAFAVDSSKAWAYPITMPPVGGMLNMAVHGDPFRGMIGGTVKPSANDYCTVIAQNPELIYEQNKIKSTFNNTAWVTANGGTLQLENRMAFTYSAPTFITHYRYFPVLKRPNADVGQNIITNEGGRLFSLSLRLVVDTAQMFAFHPDVDQSAGQANSWIEESGLATIGPAVGQATLDRPNPSGVVIDIRQEGQTIPQLRRPWWA